MKNHSCLAFIVLLLNIADIYGNDLQNEKRLKNLITADARKKPDPANSFAFGGKARFAGYIKGYDSKRSSLDMLGILYAGDVFTQRENAPYVIELDDTGWFQVEFDLNAPARISVALGKSFLNPYAEPGLTTALVLDWDDWLSNKNQKFELKKSFFTGVTGRLNNELYELRKIEMERFYSQKFENVEEIISTLTSAKNSALKQLDNALKQKDYLPLTHQLAKSDILTNYGEQVLLKIGDMKVRSTRTVRVFRILSSVYVESRAIDSIPHGRYDFIKEILDEPLATASLSFSSFINRYEYCDIFQPVPDLCWLYNELYG